MKKLRVSGWIEWRHGKPWMISMSNETPAHRVAEVIPAPFRDVDISSNASVLWATDMLQQFIRKQASNGMACNPHHPARGA